MIPNKIQNVFKLIDYLHSHIEKFKDYIPEVDKCLNIIEEMDKLDPEHNFDDRNKYEELNNLKNREYDNVYINVTKRIIDKCHELDLLYSDQDKHEFNWGFNEIEELKRNAAKDDLPIIDSSKHKYIEYKRAISSDFLSLSFFFSRLHQYLKEIFVFFDTSIVNDLESFEIESIQFDTFSKQQHSTDNLISPTKQSNSEFDFSILEWATIFYYADETKLLSKDRAATVRWKKFMSKHKIPTTSASFKKNYYEAKKRINEKNDYPIHKLHLIIPFLESNYPQTVSKVRNDITFLEQELAD